MYKLISWAAVVCWMAVIFYFSHQPSGTSSELSFGITERVAAFAERVIPSSDLNLDGLHHYIRKTAHFLVYLLLGILACNVVRVRKASEYIRIMLALLICVLFATSDEMHQLFISGRSGEVRDVLIDSIGASIGIVLFLIVKTAMRKRKTGRAYDGSHRGNEQHPV